MADRNGVERVINVAVCRRIGDSQSVLVCARCYNEIEGTVSEFFADEVAFDAGVAPRYNYCPWCAAPLKETDDG